MTEHRHGTLRRSIGFMLLLVMMCVLGSIRMAGFHTSAAVQKPALNKKKVVTYVGQTAQLKLNNAKGKITWKSSRPSIVSVKSTGKIQAKHAGKATITASYKGKKYTCSVTVYSTRIVWKSSYYLPNKYKVAGNTGKIVVAGSSSIDRWKTASSDFAPYKVVNTGISGTRVQFWLKNYKKLITRYKPKAVVLFVGGNNITGAPGGDTGKETAQMLKQLLTKIRKDLPDAKIFYVSIHPNIKRWKAWDQVKVSNRLVKQFCSTHKNMYYIDITKACLNAKGLPNGKLLTEDNLHFNSVGYTKIWKNIVAAKVKANLSK